jgi:hypothetical protein
MQRLRENGLLSCTAFMMTHRTRLQKNKTRLLLLDPVGRRESDGRSCAWGKKITAC